MAIVVIIVIAAWVVVPTLVGHHIGAEKRRAGAAWGLFLGWFGVLIVAILPSSPHEAKRVAAEQASFRRECPHCKEPMRRDATVCPHCRIESDAWRLLNGKWWQKRDDGFHVLDERTGQWAKVHVTTFPPENKMIANAVCPNGHRIAAGAKVCPECVAYFARAT